MPIDTRISCLEQYLEYLKTYSLSTISDNPSLLKRFLSIYKNYHALLVWHTYFVAKRPSYFKNEVEYQSFKMYFEESVSDTCEGIFIALQGLYKPALLITRSSIENFIKLIGLYEKQNILTLTSVYELIEFVKNLPIVNKTSVTKRSYETLRRNYKALCSHVHTSDVNHMSLTNAVGYFPRYEESKLDNFIEIVNSVIKTMCTFYCYMFNKEFHKMNHKDHDYICDVLPKSVKLEIA